MRFDGTLKSWNDDKGFGFISPSQGGQDIFVHISEYRRGGRPVLDEPLSFEVALNPQGKKSAVNVRGAGTHHGAYQPDRSNRPVRISRSGGSSSSVLKFVVVMLLVAVFGWQGYRHYQKVSGKLTGEPAILPTPHGATPLLDLAPSSRAATASYVCDGRQHCSQMTSCAEATWFLKNCPGTKMDGDHDSVPCEAQLCR
jgi:cold shock CspA family protein